MVTATRRRWIVPAAVVGLATAFLLTRLAPDVGANPVHQDEALAGLIAARPLPEVLETVVVDRGGAPLHFVLAHAVFAFDASPEALRWLSVVFALLAVGLCYDLGRRVAGTVGGTTAALLAATSALLAAYGSFGRMYALFAFASALAVDLFVRALQLRTGRAAAVAALGAWVLAASHPYGGIIVALEALVAVAVWRGRPLRPALPVALVSLAFVPLLLADLRLAERFTVGVGEGDAQLASPRVASRLFVEGMGGLAGGRAPVFLLFAALALVGLVTWARRLPALAAFTVLALAAIPMLLVLGSSGGGVEGRLSTRHFIYCLPFWTALVGTGVSRLVEERRRAVVTVAVVATVVVALAAPSAITPPGPSLASGSTEGTAAPAAWLRRNVRAGDVLFPSSPVFLAALPATRHAVPLSRNRPSSLIRRSLERIQLPVGAAHVAVPLDFAERVDVASLRTELGPEYVITLFDYWLVITARGPFHEPRAVAEGIAEALRAAQYSVAGGPELESYFRIGFGPLCGALRSLGGECPPRTASGA